VRITPDEWERYWLADNAVGVVDVAPEHVYRVAEILSERFPGIILIWRVTNRGRRCDLSAVRPDRRRMSDSLESRIVAAGEKIAESVANKHPVRWRLFRKRVRDGWHYAEPKPKG
jgi:hypothetical protein